MSDGQNTLDRGPAIYSYIAEHQRTEDWEQRTQAGFLHAWIKRMNQEFKLQLTEVTLKLGKLPIHLVSLFRPGHNEFGLRGEITFNSCQLARLPLGANLTWLAHAVLHAWQHEHGRPPEKPDCHNREYRAKAADFGLDVSADGKTSVQRGGPFAGLVTSCGIALEWDTAGARTSVYSDQPAALSRLRTRPKGNSKLKKWICSCSPPVNVRVAVAEFQALCLRCNTRFHLEESTSSGPQEADR